MFCYFKNHQIGLTSHFSVLLYIFTSGTVKMCKFAMTNLNELKTFLMNKMKRQFDCT